MRIGGLRGNFTFAAGEEGKEIPAQWTRFAAYLGKVPAQVGWVTYGICFPGSGRFDYLSGVEVSTIESLPPEWSVVEIPAQAYAVFAHEDHVSKLHAAIDTIWRERFPATGFRALTPGPGQPAFFERYGEKFDPKTETGDIEIWIPIQSAARVA